MALDHDHVAAGEILCAEKTLELAPLGDDGAQNPLASACSLHFL
jgi:hypothetical protein